MISIYLEHLGSFLQRAVSHVGRIEFFPYKRSKKLKVMANLLIEVGICCCAQSLLSHAGTLDGTII